MSLDFERIRSILTDALGGELGTFTTQGGATIPAIQVDDGTEDLVQDWEKVEGLVVTIFVDFNLPITQLLGNKALITEGGAILLEQCTPGDPILQPTQRAMMALKQNYPNLQITPATGTRARQKLDAIASMSFSFSLDSHWVQ